MYNSISLGRASIKKWIILTIANALVLGAAATSAEVPPRFYWKSLSGTNAIPAIASFIEGNANPFDPSLHIPGSFNVEGEVVTAGFARMFTVGDRAALAAVLDLPSEARFPRTAPLEQHSPVPRLYPTGLPSVLPLPSCF